MDPHAILESIVAKPGQVLPALRHVGNDRWAVDELTGLRFEDAVREFASRSAGQS